tara:strand:- start:614 stop:868 length:255 start_codon:yes stop_codon:yes gene_type:complete
MIKYFCDDCDKELKFDGFAEESESAGRGYATHFHDIGIVHEDRENEDMNARYQHTCRECDLKQNGKESFYHEEDTTYEYLGIFL